MILDLSSPQSYNSKITTNNRGDTTEPRATSDRATSYMYWPPLTE
jgi:hypothetical protein